MIFERALRVASHVEPRCDQDTRPSALVGAEYPDERLDGDVQDGLRCQDRHRTYARRDQALTLLDTSRQTRGSSAIPRAGRRY